MAQNAFLDVFTFSTEEIRDINKLFFDEYLLAPDINFLHTFYQGIKADSYIGFIGEGGLVGVAGTGCEKTASALNIDSRQLKWSPKQWEIFLEECKADLEGKMTAYSMADGTSRYDLTGTDYMTIITQVLTESFKKFIWRLVWFSDTAAANAVREDLPTVALTVQPAVGQPIEGVVYVGTTSTGTKGALADHTVKYTTTAAATGNVVAATEYYSRSAVTTSVYSGGVITAGIATKYFTILNGLWKQLLTAIVAHPELHVNIAANEEFTTALQKSAFTPALAEKMLEDMIEAAPIAMRDPSKAFIVCTQSVADKYARYLKGLGIESTYTNLVDGINALKFDGYDVIPMPIWDETISKYENLDGKLNNPHRALFIEKANLAIGTPSTGIMEELKIWYSDDQFKNFIFATDFLDTLLLNDQRFVLAI